MTPRLGVRWVGLLCASLVSCTPVAGDGGASPAPSGVLSESSWSRTALAGIAAGEYAPSPTVAGFEAVNRGQGLRAAFGAGRVDLSGRAGGAGVSVALRGWGRGAQVSPAVAVPPEEGDCLAGGDRDAFGECLHRVAYARPGLEEWWENRPDGLELGFTVTAPPPGEGPLVLELDLGDADVVQDGEGALIRPVDGPMVRCSAVTAWDARGRALEASLIATAGGLRLSVDDSDALGAITVDPVFTDADWTTDGESSGADYGSAVAILGDVNGDGFDDVAVGARSEAGSLGRVYVYHGSWRGLAATASWMQEGTGDVESLGASVAGGDINGDGYADIVVGSPYYERASDLPGRARVYFGSRRGLDSTPVWTFDSDQPYGVFGVAVSAAGDVNGDGYNDVLVGAMGYSADSRGYNQGRVSLFYGGAGGPSAVPDWILDGDTTNEWLGERLAIAPDLDGDGYDEILLGSPSVSGGRAWMYRGSASGPAASPDWTVEGAAGSNLGEWVVAAGDVDGDGWGDVIVVAGEEDGAFANEGAGFLYRGSATGLATTPAWSWSTGEADGGMTGGAAGDLNGDGYSDVVLTSRVYSGDVANDGRVWVFMGSAAGLGAEPVWSEGSGQEGSGMGWAASASGDVNGDGYDDLVVGAAEFASGRTRTGQGRAFLYLGSALGVHGSGSWSQDGAQANAHFGASVASAGDVDGDGFDDVIVGAPEYDGGALDEGRAFLYLGSHQGLAATASWTVESNQAGGALGAAVAAAGDVNGDGFGDLAIGAPGYDGGEADEGRVWVYLGSRRGPRYAGAWRAESDQAGARFGTAVAAAGDVNGDGYADLVVGAPWFDATASDEGQAWLYLGSAGGLSAAPAWTASAGQAGARLGAAVGGGGDVNGDGLADVLVGAPLYDGAYTNAGRVYGYLGTSTGLPAVADWTADGTQRSAAFGMALALDADVNGDGYDDIVIGAPYMDDSHVDEGQIALFVGSASGPAATPDVTTEGGQDGAFYGSSLDYLGDASGDGLSEVVVGSPYWDGGVVDGGKVSVFLGSTTGMGGIAVWSVIGGQAGALLGASVAGAGDVDGDGLGDLVFGVPYLDGDRRNEGAVWAYR